MWDLYVYPEKQCNDIFVLAGNSYYASKPDSFYTIGVDNHYVGVYKDAEKNVRLKQLQDAATPHSIYNWWGKNIPFENASKSFAN